MSSPFQQRFSAKSPLNQVDTDEPPVVRGELDAKGKKIYDDLRIENARLLKSGMTQKEIDAKNLKEMREKKKKEQDK